MRRPRPLLLLCLFAYLWASLGLAGAVWASVFAYDDHHQASVQQFSDGVAYIYSHEGTHHHEHGLDDGDHVVQEHEHDDHVLKLPNPPDSTAPVAKDIKHDKLATAPTCIPIDQPSVSSHRSVQRHAQAPPLCRNRSVVLRQSVVLLI